MLDGPAAPQTANLFERDLIARLERRARRVACFVTEERKNDFPRLPVREGEWAIVITGICASLQELDEFLAVLNESDLAAVTGAAVITAERLRLQPGSRALYR